MSTSTFSAGTLSKMGRTELAQIPVPLATKTHRPVPHHEIVEALVETLSFRHIGVVNEEYAVSGDGMKMFGTRSGNPDGGLSICSRSSQFARQEPAPGPLLRPESFCVLEHGILRGFSTCFGKAHQSFNLIDTLSVGVDRIQRNFEPMRRQVEKWRQTQMTDEQAKLILYAAFVEGKLDAPKSLLADVHRLYFEPEHPEFAARTMWSLSNALTSAFKKLDPIPQFKATAKLGEFLSFLPTD